ncbi:hypothetical protein TIFTF001_042588 [Ficus carica]|nr:hypothetical protein TIFTF001_042586 [Ficus carica]GMN37180.1 hypothetical protein TIFTF001_042588 [Ficus carica]
MASDLAKLELAKRAI